MYWLAIPVTLATKTYITSKVSDGIANGIHKGTSTAKSEVLKKIYKGLYSSFLNVTFNIIVLCIAVYLIPKMVSEKETSNFIISTIYLVSILQGMMNFLLKIPILSKIIFAYKFNLKSYLKDEIYTEVHKQARIKAENEINNTFIIVRPIVRFFSPQPKNIAHSVAHSTSIRASKIIFHEIIKKVLILTLLFSSYYLIFRYIVAPFLLSSTTDMNMLETLIYPLRYSISFFFNF